MLLQAVMRQKLPFVVWVIKSFQGIYSGRTDTQLVCICITPLKSEAEYLSLSVNYYFPKRSSFATVVSLTACIAEGIC